MVGASRAPRWRAPLAMRDHRLRILAAQLQPLSAATSSADPLVQPMTGALLVDPALTAAHPFPPGGCALAGGRPPGANRSGRAILAANTRVLPRCFW